MNVPRVSSAVEQDEQEFWSSVKAQGGAIGSLVFQLRCGREDKHPLAPHWIEP